ncbi:retinol dehydrogenase 11-like [Actinia tenebrosa]|uniref:Retinol dehydrogenase 11-like n=1 Tax=Actinia tenebrosa TaxID=6105 RepID=A0A6P8HMP7_ACTTE|nr:retinol dehydrogenase 11-like [Actinia tenebrosa]
MASIPVAVAVGVGGALGLYFARQYFKGGEFKSTRRLDGKTVIITGANTGIGKETAIDLAKRGARVIIACRSPDRGKQALKEIQEQSNSQQVYLEKLDLASLKSVREFAEKIKKNEPRLDILINNAGVMMCPYMTTEDGFELQIGVNHLGHFLLTNLLLDLLKKSAPSRVINLSSLGHTMTSRFKFQNMNNEKTYGKVEAYAQSKLANILFTKELARRLEGTGVTTYAVHPGTVETELDRHTFFSSSILGAPFRPIRWLTCKTPIQGAQTSLYCAVSEDLEGVTGRYYADCAETPSSEASKNEEDAKTLWDVSVELVGL